MKNWVEKSNLALKMSSEHTMSAYRLWEEMICLVLCSEYQQGSQTLQITVILWNTGVFFFFRSDILLSLSSLFSLNCFNTVRFFLNSVKLMSTWLKFNNNNFLTVLLHLNIIEMKIKYSYPVKFWIWPLKLH